MGIEIPSAVRTKVLDCGDPECEHAHLVGFDHEGIPFCEIVVDEGMVLQAFTIINENRKP